MAFDVKEDEYWLVVYLSQQNTVWHKNILYNIPYKSSFYFTFL